MGQTSFPRWQNDVPYNRMWNHSPPLRRTGTTKSIIWNRAECNCVAQRAARQKSDFEQRETPMY